MFIKSTDATEVANIIQGLKEYNARGGDIDAKVVKASFDSSSSHLHMFSICLCCREQFLTN